MKYKQYKKCKQVISEDHRSIKVNGTDNINQILLLFREEIYLLQQYSKQSKDIENR